MDTVYLVAISKLVGGAPIVRILEAVALPDAGTLAAARDYLEGEVWPRILEESPTAQPADYRVDYAPLTNLSLPFN